MNCITINDVSFSEANHIIDKLSASDNNIIFEIRLDLLEFDENQLNQILHKKEKFIVTCRENKFSKEKRKKLLFSAINCGAEYIDLDIDSDSQTLIILTNSLKHSNCKLIVSYHNMEKTPDYDFLKTIVNRCKKFNPDIIKIACKINNEKDLHVIFSLYALQKNIIALGMGEKGKISRVVAKYLGTKFSYSCYQKKSANGQLSYQEMKKIERILDNE